MASLTQQLSALRARNAGARDPRKVKSLLLSSQEAATIDSASLHDAATAALAELSAGPSGDARLGAFAGSLFGPSSVSFERELHTREENARVDRSVVALLRLLSPHFLRAAAHRVLEFLIRRYRICECNVDAVIECALPCHDSPLFARVVQLLELEGTSWRFLVADSHQSASPLPRSVLAKRCAGDGSLREFIFALARHAAEHCGAEPSAAWERHFAFYGATLSEAVGIHAAQVSDGLVRQLLPQLAHGISCVRVPEYQAASMMVAAQLCARCTLSGAATESLLSIVATHMCPGGGALRTLACTLAIVETQPTALDMIPVSVFTPLARAEGLTLALEQLSASHDTTKLLRLLTDALVALLPLKGERLLCELTAADGLALGALVPSLTARVLAKRAQHTTADETDAINRVLASLARHYSSEFSRAIDDSPATDGADAFDRMMTFPAPDTGTALILALSHHDAQVRAKAVQRATEVDVSEDARAELKTALLERVNDEDAHVVRAVLRKGAVQLLQKLWPARTLIDRGLVCSRRWTASLRTKPKRSVPVVQAALRFLCSVLADSDSAIWSSPGEGRDDGMCAEVTSAFLEHLPCGYGATSAERSAGAGGASKADAALGRTAMQCAAQVPHSLFRHLAGLSVPHEDHAANGAQEDALALDVCQALGNALGEADTDAVVSTILQDGIEFANEDGGTLSHSQRVLLGALDWRLEHGVAAAADTAAVLSYGDALVHHLSRHADESTDSRPEHLAALASTARRMLSIAPSHGQSLPAGRSFAQVVMALCARAPETFEPLVPLVISQQCPSAPLRSLAMIFSSSPAYEPAAAGAGVATAAQAHALAVAGSLVRALPRREVENGSIGRKLQAQVRALLDEACEYGVPAAIVALAHPHARVREAALTLLRAFGDALSMSGAVRAGSASSASTKSAALCGELCESLARSAEELVVDPANVRHRLRILLAAADASGGRDGSSKPSESLRHYVAESAVRFGTEHAYQSALLLGALSDAPPLGMWDALKPFLLEVLASGVVSTDPSDLSSLSALRSVLLDVLETVCSLTPASETFEALLACLASDAPEAIERALSILSSGFATKLANNDCKMLLGRLIELMLTRTTGRAAELLQDVMRSLPLGADTLHDVWSALLPTDDGTLSASPSKRRRTSSPPPDWQARLVILLEAVQSRAEEDARALVRDREAPGFEQLLHVTLRQLLALGTAESLTEYAKCLVLHLLLDRFSALPSDVEERSDEADESHAPSKRRRRERSHLQRAQADTAARVTVDDVDQILACARETPSPQTREAALLLLAALAEHFPAQMTTAWLPVLATSSRPDDGPGSSRAFSAALVHKVIDRVLPALRQHGSTGGVSLCDVIGVFVDALGSIPTQHRVGVFCAVIKALSHNGLGSVTLLLLRRSLHGTLPAAAHGAVGTNGWQDLCHSLCHRHSPALQMDALGFLLEGVHAMARRVVESDEPGFGDSTRGSSSPTIVGRNPSGFVSIRLSELRLADGNATCSLALIIARFIGDHLQTPALFQRVRSDGGASADDGVLQAAYLDLCQQLLALLKMCSHARSARLRTVLAPQLTIILDAARVLLSTPSFVAVVLSLLGDEDPFTRRKALEILGARLTESSVRAMPHEEQALCVEMLPDLHRSMQRAAHEPPPPRRRTGDEAERTHVDVETAVQAVTILARAFARQFAAKFVPLLDAVAGQLSENAPQSTSCYLCIATLCAALGPRAFPKLSVFLPPMLHRLEQAAEKRAPHAAAPAGQRDAALLVQSVLSALASVTSSLPNFLHPHVKRILELLTAFAGVTSPPAIPQLVNTVLQNIATHMQPRILLPLVFELYPACLRAGRLSAASLLKFLASVLAQLPASQSAAHIDALGDFVLRALEKPLSSVGGSEDASDVDDGSIELSSAQPGGEDGDDENPVAAVALAVVLKLSERQLKPFLLKLHAWKSADQRPRPAAGADGRSESAYNEWLGRKTGVYAVLERVGSALQEIFVPYATIFWTEFKDDLELLIASVAEGRAMDKDACVAHQSSARALISALRTCLRHDAAAGGALSKSQLETVAQPLVETLDALARSSFDSAELVQTHAVPCLSQLATCSSASDAFRKGLNHKLLMKTRAAQPAVRLAALRALHACFEAVGEEYLVLLPECLPFLSELLEDSSPEVEALCRRVVADMSELSGEELGQFFL